MMKIIKKLVFENGIEQDIILDFLDKAEEVYDFDCVEYRALEILRKIAREGY